MMKKFNSILNILLMVFILLFFSNSSMADVYEHPAALSSIAEKIPVIESVKCKFKQEKTMPNIAKPLVSGGDFEFVKDKGVYFYTLYPIKSTVDYTNKNYKQVNDIVKAISAKKYEKLEKEFSFFFTGNSGNWTLGLKPKQNSPAKNYITSITIQGSSYINQININQTNGNKTAIWFIK